MTKAETGCQVVVNFTVRTNEGAIVGEGPQTLTLGNGEAFRSIEDALIGMSEGDEKSLRLPSDEAFGPRRDELMLRIPRSELPADGTPTPGMQLAGKNERGETVHMTITEVSDDAIIADANHPLAGVDLNVALAVVKVAKPA